MGTFDFLYTKTPAAGDAKEWRTRAESANKRCQELRAELAQTKHAVKALRTELETLRRCLAAGETSSGATR